MARSNTEWKRWGDTDPLHGVATSPGTELNGPAAWTPEAFYAQGLEHWTRFYERWRRFGLREGSCLEIGCGAGRITTHLADHFGIVYAMDVSQGMIAYARRHLTCTNVRYQIADATALALGAKSVDAVFSTHVFQHLDSTRDVTESLREIARVLVPGGTTMIHIPILQWPPGMHLPGLLYGVRKRVGDLRAKLVRPFVAKGIGRPLMRYRAYQVDHLFRVLKRADFSEVDISLIAANGEGDVHPFVLARRA